VLIVSSIIIFVFIAATYKEPIMVNYYGKRADLRQLENRIEELGCDDHLGPGILTCYNTFEESMAANHCRIGANRGVIYCEP
jgi:hypothetical protein